MGCYKGKNRTSTRISQIIADLNSKSVSLRAPQFPPAARSKIFSRKGRKGRKGFTVCLPLRPLRSWREALRNVAQTFLSAGSGDFPVASSYTELESSVNPQVGKPALHRRRKKARKGSVLTIDSFRVFQPRILIWAARQHRPTLYISLRPLRPWREASAGPKISSREGREERKGFPKGVAEGSVLSIGNSAERASVLTIDSFHIF